MLDEFAITLQLALVLLVAMTMPHEYLVLALFLWLSAGALHGVRGLFLLCQHFCGHSSRSPDF
jgi:hypothetical protein